MPQVTSIAAILIASWTMCLLPVFAAGLKEELAQIKTLFDSTPFTVNVLDRETWTYGAAANVQNLALRGVLATVLAQATDASGIAQNASLYNAIGSADFGIASGVFLYPDQARTVTGAFNGSIVNLALASRALEEQLRAAIATQTANITAAPHTQARFAKLGQHTGVPFINLVNEDSVSLHMRMFGEWESLQTELLQSFIQPGDVVVDVGAHIGTHAIGFALSVGSTGTVHAFEAQPGVADVLRLNAELNGLSNVVVHNAAVGGGWSGAAVAPRQVSVRVLDLSASSNANLDGDAGLANNIGGLSLLGCDSRGVELSPSFEGGALLRECQSGGTGSDDHVWVDVVSLDDVLGFGGSGGGPGGVTGGKCPSVVKIDVEGMELQVLKGAVKVLEACRPVLHVENNVDADGASKAVIDYLTSLHYDLYWELGSMVGESAYYGPASYSFAEQAAANNGRVGGASVNLLAIPAPPFLTEHVHSVFESAQTQLHMTRVDPTKPLLSQYEGVSVYQASLPTLNMQSVVQEADGVMEKVGTIFTFNPTSFVEQTFIRM